MVTREYPTKVSILTCLSVIVAVGVGFEFKCPEPSQWKFRKKMCGTAEKYSCLYDIKKREYVESCSDKKDFVKPGKRYVRIGGRDSADCDNSRYQPKKFWSDQTSDCEMLKSICSEEGQVAVSDGSTTEDSACRCDSLHGFGSITTETIIFSCIPSVEDCYCYRTKYDKVLDYGKITKTSWKYALVRESVIMLPESRASAGMSWTVYTSDEGHNWQKQNRNGNGITDSMLRDLFLFSCLCIFIAIIGIAFVFSQVSNDSKCESEYRMLQDLILNNWQTLLENGNPVTLKNTFLNANVLTEYLQEFDTSLPRAILVDLLLTRCLQYAKEIEDIQLISSVINRDLVSATIYGNETDDAPSAESTESIELYADKLFKHSKKIGDNLNEEDVTFIRGQLVQNRIIDLTENKQLRDLKGPIRNLIEHLISLIINKLSAGSYQCFIQSLKKIYKKKRRERILDLINILKNDSTSDEESTQNNWLPVEHVKSTVYQTNIEGKENYTVRIKAKTQEGQEVDEVYQRLQNNPEDLNRIMSSNLGGTVENTGSGSLIINLQMMERNMQDNLKHCLRRGKVTTLVQMLFSDISLEKIIPDGKLHIQVTIEVNEVNDISPGFEPQSYGYPDITRFVIDNRSFLLEEMDTDAMVKTFKDFGVEIPTDEHYKGRKEKANHILKFVVKNKLQRIFMLFIEVNQETKFSHLLRRLNAYTRVYETKLEILRKNILLQFSEIVSNIDISDIQDVLIDRNAVEMHMLLEIRYNYSTNREMRMAALLLNILKSGDAARAFVDALFIMNSFLAKQMLRCESEFSVIEKGPNVEIRDESLGNRLLIDGHFIIKIIQSDLFPSSIRNDPNGLSIEPKLDLAKQRQILTTKMIEFEEILLNWLEDAESVIRTLKDLADELDVHFTRINKAKISGSAAGIVGGVLGIVGLALTPFTFGASLGLAIAGGAVAGIGGVTVGGSLIADSVLSKKTQTKAQKYLSNYSNSVEKVKRTCLDLSRQLGKSEKLKDNFPHWVRFWMKFTHGQSSNTSEFSWEDTQELLNKTIENVGSAARFVIGEGMGTGVRIAGAALRVTGTSLHVISGVIGALMIPLDIFTIVASAIDLHKKNKHNTSLLIIRISETLWDELPTEENIKHMIMLTIINIHRNT